MSRQVSPSTDKVYGLQRVTRCWGVSRATVYRHRHLTQAVERKRPGPLGAMSDDDLVAAIRQLLTDSPFHGEGYRKLWARLRFKGIRTSRRRVLRLMRAHGLLAPQRAGRPRGPKAHDGTITTDQVDRMWGTDSSELTRAALTVTLQSSLSITARPNALAFMPAAASIASRRSSRSSRQCASALARSPRISPSASSFAMTTEANMSVTIFKPRSASSVLEAHRPSCGSLKATAAPSGSSVC
jgi:hypothetical protein